MDTAHLVLSTQFTKHLTEQKMAFLKPEEPRLRTEINNHVSPRSLSAFSPHFQTSGYCINAQENSNLVTT